MRKLAVPIVASALLATVIATPALAKGGPPDGVEAGNNLSVPTVFVTGDATGLIPGTAPTLRVPCLSAPQAPGADGVAAVDGYWLQKTEATWSASCSVVADAGVTLDWGDNLTGTTALKAGKVIRVETVLYADGVTGTAYPITNLSPEGTLDRLAVYGTDGTAVTGTAAVVWDHDADFTITNVATGVSLTVPATAEINSMGAIVYGYNWGQKGDFAPAGEYTITFTVSEDTTIGAVVDWNADTMSLADHAVTLDLTLTPKAGGGGRGR